MKIQTSVLVVFLVICGARLLKGQELEDESEFSYIVGSPNGPSNWGFLHPEWAVCNNGTMQSPIALPSLRPEPVPVSQSINFCYNPANATVKNRGHDIEVKWAQGASKIRINGVDYILKQLHWHTPSEHTISGIRYAMEVHLVHQTPDNKTAVFAILYKLGNPDPFLAQLMDEITAISDSSNEIEAGVVNPVQLLVGRGSLYYRYNGSLTTPPCTQGVLWTVDTKIGTVSQQQIDLLRQAVDDNAAQNARPLQPRNGRMIKLYCNHPY
ncbi:hypothetical protein V2J09_009709 [Rumex salicifolius]